MKSYKVKYVAPLAIAGIAAVGLVVGNSLPAAGADLAVYGPKSYGTNKNKKKAMYGTKTYGAKKQKKSGYGAGN